MSEFAYTRVLAHHEAGHGVVWEALTGRRPFEYVFAPHRLLDPHAAVDLLRGHRARFWRRYHRPACITLAAGAAAEARFQRRRFSPVWKSGVCESDRAMFEVLRRKCGAEADELFSDARRLVNEHWMQITIVANDLYACDGNLTVRT